MPLISSTTNLKDLKYGNDRRGGGNSGQPYIKKDIPSKENDLSDLTLYGTGGPDFLLRGGTLNIGKTADDIVRLTKFFTDTKSLRGPLFILNQNLLSRSSVKTEASFGLAYGGGRPAGNSPNIVGTGPVNEGIYIPTSTLLQVAGLPFGAHLNKQGLDPTGLFGDAAIRKYSEMVGSDTNNFPKEANRLYKLYVGKILNFSQDDNVNIYEYSGGPGSVLGIGHTKIKFADKRTGYSSNIMNFDTYQVGNKSSVTLEETQLYKRTGVEQINPSIILKGASAEYNKLKPINSDQFRWNAANNFETDQNSNQDDQITISRKISGYGTKNLNNPRIESSINDIEFPSVYEPNSLKVKTKYITDSGSQKSTGFDDGNLLNGGSTKNRYKADYGGFLIKKENSSNNDPELYKDDDIVEFFITIINNEGNSGENRVLYFPANIESWSENFISEWSSQRYMGRGEDFHTYNGFNRTMNFGFKIHPNTPEQLDEMWNQLNILASSLLPDYSGTGFMRGNIFKLSLGNYIQNLPGIVKGFTFNIVDNDVTWDLDKIMPKYIEIKSFEFQPIHNFLPRTGENLFGRKLYGNDNVMI